VKVRARDISFVQRCGTFRSALYMHIQETVTSLFAAAIASVSVNDNLTLLTRVWKDEETTMRGKWLAICASSMFLVEDQVELSDDAAHHYICRTTGKQGPFLGESPFSWIVFQKLQALQSKSEQLAGAKSRLTCLRDELTESYGHIFVAEEFKRIQDYTRDFVRMAYDLGSEGHAVEEIFTCLLLQVATLESKPDIDPAVATAGWCPRATAAHPVAH